MNNNWKLKWENDLVLTLDSYDWKKINKVCFYSIRDNFLIWFQYKVLHRLTSTNLYLQKIKQSEIATCRLCHEHEESIVHLFAHCQKATEFWNCLKNWINRKINVNINFSPSVVIFGTWQNYSFDVSINVLIITAKYYILKCARSNKSLSFFEYERYLQNIFNEQLMLSHFNMSTHTFLKSWSMLAQLLNS